MKERKKGTETSSLERERVIPTRSREGTVSHKFSCQPSVIHTYIHTYIMIPMKTRITRSRPRPDCMEESEGPPTLSFSDGDDRDNNSLSSLSDNSSLDGKGRARRDFISNVKQQNQHTYNNSSSNDNGNLTHSLSAEAHSELDQLMDIVNTGIEEPKSQVAKHNPILQGNHDSTEVLSSFDAPPDKSANIVTRRVLKLRQRERSLSKPKQLSSRDGNKGDDQTITARTVSSHGHKSILTSATGYTEGTGTTAPHANTVTARLTRKFKRKKDSCKMKSQATIPQCITMSCSGDTDASSAENQQQGPCSSTSALMVTKKTPVSAMEANMISPKDLALARKIPSKRRFKNNLDETAKLNIIARRLVQAQSEAEHKKYRDDSSALGMVQSLFECCSLQQIVEEETSGGVPEYSDIY